MGEARGLNNARFEGEWEEVTLGEIGKTYGGLSGKTSADFGQGNARYISFLDVLEQVTVTRRRFDRVRVSSSESQNRVASGDVLFNATSETPEDLAMGSMALVDSDQLYLNSFCFGLRMADRSRCDSLFLAYFFRGIPGRAAMYGLAQGATRYNLSKQRFLRIQVPLPPLPEQRAIAAVLSDVDELIGSLEALIAKKRAIKQAAMQELLTGRTRLLGFGGEWEMRRVSGFGEVVTGGTPHTGTDAYWRGPYPWITPTDISSRRDMTTSERTITKEGLAAIRRLPADTVLVTCIASIGKNAILRTTGSCNQQINAIIPNATRYSSEFLYYLFEFNARYLLTKAGTTATSIVSKKTLSRLRFDTPAIEEQRAIATILSDMDAEIAALEHRLDKTRAIKQGMMQQLLTGSIRLPIPDDDTENDDAHDA